MRLPNWLKRSETPKEYGLAELQGTYRGFSPTDESPIAMGELEVSVTAEAVKIRHAAGHRIDEEEIPTSKFRPMSRDELSTVYQDGSKYVDRSVGFAVGDVQYVFLPQATDDEFGLLIIGNGMANMLGPTIAYSPAQIERGVYDKAVAETNSQSAEEYPNGCFPTLKAGGNMPD